MPSKVGYHSSGEYLSAVSKMDVVLAYLSPIQTKTIAVSYATGVGLKNIGMTSLNCSAISKFTNVRRHVWPPLVTAA